MDKLKEHVKDIVRGEIGKILPIVGTLDNHLFLDYVRDDYKVNLNEGLYKTYPPSTAVRYIKNLFGLEDKDIWVHDNQNSSPEEKRLVTVYADVYGNREKMKKAMLLCGYTLSKCQKDDDGTVREIYIPINLPNLNDIVRKYSFITHITPSYNKDKILSKGFIPKSKNEMFSYTDRVFFFKGDTPMQEILFQAMDFDNHLKNKRNNHIYTIFILNTSKIPDNVHFHTDLTYPCGIYTTENIPPQCIKSCQDFDVASLRKQYFGFE